MSPVNEHWQKEPGKIKEICSIFCFVLGSLFIPKFLSQTFSLHLFLLIIPLFIHFWLRWGRVTIRGTVHRHWHEHEGDHENEHGLWLSFEHEWGFHRQSLGWVPAFARARARTRVWARVFDRVPEWACAWDARTRARVTVVLGTNCLAYERIRV